MRRVKTGMHSPEVVITVGISRCLEKGQAAVKGRVEGVAMFGDRVVFGIVPVKGADIIRLPQGRTAGDQGKYSHRRQQQAIMGFGHKGQFVGGI